MRRLIRTDWPAEGDTDFMVIISHGKVYILGGFRTTFEWDYEDEPCDE